MITATATIVVAVIGFFGIWISRNKSEDKPRNSAINVVTHGPNSPGIVYGNVVINQTIIKQYTETHKKTWRELSFFTYAAQKNTMHERGWGENVFKAAIEAFDEKTKFVFLAWSSESIIDGNPVMQYHTASSKSDFIDCQTRLRHEALSFISKMKKDIASGRRTRDEVQVVADALPNVLSGWDISGDFGPPLKGFTPVECSVDPIKRTVRMNQLSTSSLDPDDYKNDIGTTSEFFKYFAAVENSGPIAQLGDLETFFGAGNYRLQKLLTAMLDEGAIALSRLRVSSLEDEEWDYINLNYDLEVKQRL